jgi:hypothetical protein
MFIQLHLVLVHIDKTNSANLKALSDQGLLHKERYGILLLSGLCEVYLIVFRCVGHSAH